MFVTYVAKLYDPRFKWVEWMHGFVRVDCFLKKTPCLTLFFEPVPLVLHTPPVEFVVKYAGGKIVHDDEQLREQEVTHLAGENGRIRFDVGSSLEDG